jgi:CDP-diacylglycerol--glycerol-3-phosphate 3-phosphatidyltransferase
VEPVCRPGTALAAALVLAASVALALRSVARTEVQRAGAGSAWIGPRVRAWYRAALDPLEGWLAVRGWSPDTLTYAQLVVSGLAGFAYGGGAVFLAGCLVLTAGTLDILDGGLARRRGTAGPRGALVDSVADRWAEFATFVGLGVLYHRQGWMLFIVAVAAFGSQMVSYVRARAEGLGVTMGTGRAQRPERYVLLGFGSVFAGIVGHLTCPQGRPGHGALSACVIALAAASVWTSLERSRDAARSLGPGGTP